MAEWSEARLAAAARTRARQQGVEDRLLGLLSQEIGTPAQLAAADRYVRSHAGQDAQEMLMTLGITATPKKSPPKRETRMTTLPRPPRSSIAVAMIMDQQEVIAAHEARVKLRRKKDAVAADCRRLIAEHERSDSPEALFNAGKLADEFEALRDQLRKA